MASDPPRNGHSEDAKSGDAVTERVELQPMETNDVLIVTVGTALFAVAFIVLLALRTSLERSGHGRWPWIALSGVILGLIGLVYCVRRQQRMSKVNAQ